MVTPARHASLSYKRLHCALKALGPRPLAPPKKMETWMQVRCRRALSSRQQIPPPQAEHRSLQITQRSSLQQMQQLPPWVLHHPHPGFLLVTRTHMEMQLPLGEEPCLRHISHIRQYRDTALRPTCQIRQRQST